MVCLIPRPVRYELNSLPLKGGPLSLMISSGMPSTLNSSSRWSFRLAKTRGLDLKQEGEFTEVITDQNIQPAIHVEVVHCDPLPGLL